MPSKLKVAIVGLSASFALVATPLLVLSVEGAIIADDKITDMRQRMANPSALSDKQKADFQSCLEEKSIKLSAVSEIFSRWGNRVSFWPAAAEVLDEMSTSAQIEGTIEGMKCIKFEPAS